MAGSRVVVGVDGSPLSVSAVSHAARIASARGLDLVVLHAFAADLPMLGFGGGADRGEVDAHATRLLAEGTARAHAVDASLTVTTLVRDGFASQALVDASRTAALVVVGARGHGVLSRAGVGAVAMQVVTHARCPVLVVGHESASAGGGRVVVGVDGSKASLKALGAAFDEAALTGASLDVVHAWQPPRGRRPHPVRLVELEQLRGRARGVGRPRPRRAPHGAPRRQGRARGGGRRPVEGARRPQRGRGPPRRRQPGLRRVRRAPRRVDGAAAHGPQPQPPPRVRATALALVVRRCATRRRRQRAAARWRRAGRGRRPTPTRSAPRPRTGRCARRGRPTSRCAGGSGACAGRW